MHIWSVRIRCAFVSRFGHWNRKERHTSNRARTTLKQYRSVINKHSEMEKQWVLRWIRRTGTNRSRTTTRFIGYKNLFRIYSLYACGVPCLCVYIRCPLKSKVYISNLWFTCAVNFMGPMFDELKVHSKQQKTHRGRGLYQSRIDLWPFGLSSRLWCGVHTKLLKTRNTLYAKPIHECVFFFLFLLFRRYDIYLFFIFFVPRPCASIRSQLEHGHAARAFFYWSSES